MDRMAGEDRKRDGAAAMARRDLEDRIPAVPFEAAGAFSARKVPPFDSSNHAPPVPDACSTGSIPLRIEN